MTTKPLQIFWIRHAPVEKSGRYIGQTEIPALIPTTPANLAAPIPVDAVWFSSPLIRSVDTAHWLMQSIGENTAPLNIAPELMEQNFGVWEGKTYEEAWKEAEISGKIKEWNNPAVVKPDGGESFIGVCARVDHWIEAKLAENIGKPLVVVAHAGSIRAALRHALGLIPSQALFFTLDYGSMTMVEYPAGENSAMVHFVNR